jgi:uncharacterized protein with PQ loop repeat
MNLSQVLGFVGTVVMLCAYVPQIVHLQRERCSGGISRPAYALWLFASLLVLAHAIIVRDPIFVALQVGSAFATTITLILSVRYRNNICHLHAHKSGPVPGKM